MSRILVAKTAGFCYGVKRAVDTAFALAASGEPAYTLGELIHNPQIVEELARAGIVPIDTPAGNTDGKTVILRSHGVPRHVYEELERSGCRVVDATCPFVERIHKIVAGLPPEAVLLIAGDSSHPEVEGILGFCNGKYFCFYDAKNLENFASFFYKNSQKNYYLVAQTTFSVQEWQKCIEKLKKVCTNLKIFDTICIATEKRQAEAVLLAGSCDAMVVVGGAHSSNTAKLVKICGTRCKTFFIESAEDLYNCNLDGYTRIGVTAGASTPACIIKEVHKAMSEILKDQDTSENFAELFEEFEASDEALYNGKKVTAIVDSVKPTEIIVNVKAAKHTCYVPLEELTDDPAAKTEDLVKVGDEIDLVVVRTNDVEGYTMLSKKRLDALAGFEKVMDAAETGEIFEGTVIEVIKGGVLASTHGVKVFIPASQATLSKSDSLEDLLRKKVDFKILEVNRSRKRAVGSIRAVLRDQRKVLEDQFWAETEIGKKYTGTVKSLTSFGAFVNLGGVDGMVHISELSWSRIKNPAEVVSIGDTVEVYIKDIDPENRKISLGYKKTEDNPWEILKTKYEVGSICTVKVVSMTPFGAFAQIIPGVDGLIHISQISNERISKPSDVLEVGQEVETQITELDFDRKRVSLSMKALLEPEVKEEAAAESVDASGSSYVYEAGPDGATGEVPEA